MDVEPLLPELVAVLSEWLDSAEAAEAAEARLEEEVPSCAALTDKRGRACTWLRVRALT